jgi:hypothetical protein
MRFLQFSDGDDCQSGVMLTPPHPTYSKNQILPNDFNKKYFLEGDHFRQSKPHAGG